MATPPRVKGFTPDWPRLFAAYRLAEVHGGQVIQGPLHPGLDPRDPGLLDVLRRWPGSWEMRPGVSGMELLLYAPAAPAARRSWWNALLFAATGLSVLLAGSLLAGRDPLLLRGVPIPGVEAYYLPLPIGLEWGAVAEGWPFAALLLSILVAHEMGHYVAARLHRIQVTLPYFIPFPPYVSIVGTLGAFIRLRSPVLSRRALLDVGIAGPLAGFVVSVVAAALGLGQSAHAHEIAGSARAPFVLPFLGVEIWLGGSLLFHALAGLFVADPASAGPIVMSPLACAGWFGLFVTALNLLPLGQLDGGHILYALNPRTQRWVGRLLFVLLLPMGLLWEGWWVWAALVFVVGRGRIAHPPVFNTTEPLSLARTILAWLGIAVFVLTFVPRPFAF